MDTSVDVYSYQVVMSWDVGAVYCNINGSGGLSEEYNLFVSVLFAGCWTTGYYYGTANGPHDGRLPLDGRWILPHATG